MFRLSSGFGSTEEVPETRFGRLTLCRPGLQWDSFTILSWTRV